jgi:hypothetical protein
MEMKTALVALMAAAGLVFASGCGGDDDPSGNGGSGGSSGGSGGSGATGGDGMGGGGSGGTPPAVDECPTHPNVTADGTICLVNSSFSSPIMEDLHMQNGLTWVLEGPAIVGDDSAETVLTVDAGVTVYGTDASFVLIQRGSKIMAQGTAAAPVLFTSAQDAGSRGVQDWGGIVINGRAPINNPDGAAGDADAAPGEANTGRYGGTNASDNSGVLKYVRVEFAGKDIDPENELNGIAFQGVGNGTTVDFVQVHMVQDDAVEFFGGTVNVKHLVLTGANDDKVDWTGGWTGKAQFILAEELAASGDQSSDPRGIEADNSEANNSATPYSSPIISNATFIGRAGNTNNGMRLRRGTKGQVWNSIVTGDYDFCVNVTEDQTIANVADSSLTVQNLVLDCAAAAADGAATDLIGAATTVTGDPMLTDWMPGSGSPALGIGAGPTDSFFETVDYAGAFDGTNDWADGWIETATN